MANILPYGTDDPNYIAEMKKWLKKLFPAGSTVQTVTSYLSTGSGTDCIKVLAVVDGKVADVSDTVALVTGRKINNVHGGVAVPYAGINSGAYLVMNLAQDLYTGSRSKKVQKGHEAYCLRHSSL